MRVRAVEKTEIQEHAGVQLGLFGSAQRLFDASDDSCYEPRVLDGCVLVIGLI